jgi:signal transduction histidine kinase
VRVNATPEIKAAAADRIIMTVQDITPEKERQFEAKAINEERRRIAHEIHDGLAQDLAALRFKATLWHDLVESDPTQLHQELDLLLETLGGSIREVRRSIFALRPLALDELGFLPALKQFTKLFGEQYQLQISLEVTGPKEHLPSTLELPLLRIIQESLHNIGKHAQAQRAEIGLDLTQPHQISLTIRDEGQGFDPTALAQAEATGHFGLKQMRERIELINGTLSVQSQVGQGTEVRVELPF